jgi:hypothetical protein
MISIMQRNQPAHAISMSEFYKDRKKLFDYGDWGICLSNYRSKAETRSVPLVQLLLRRLCGHETAARLTNAGKEVGLLTLFDSANPAFRDGAFVAQRLYLLVYWHRRLG